MKISKPFGTWSSDITAKTASKALIELSDIQSFDGNLYWIEYRPQENGRSVIVTMDKFGAISDMFACPLVMAPRFMSMEVSHIQFLVTISIL